MCVQPRRVIFGCWIVHAHANTHTRQGWLLLLDFKTKTDFRGLEIACLLTFYGWLSYVVSFLPTWQLRLMWLLSSHMLAGILHVQITISHFSMPTYKGPAFPGVAHGEEFLRQQLFTSMDLDSGPLNDWFYGGLQWQVRMHEALNTEHGTLAVQGLLLWDAIGP